MFVRLTKAMRWKAGWLLAFVYFLCILAPTLSFALPDSHAVAPCLTEANHVPGIVHVHNDAPIRHVHKDGHLHDSSGVHSHANSDGDRHSVSMMLNGKSVPEKAPHSSDRQCCGLTCVTALPATLIDIVKPSAPTAICEIESYREVTNSAPPRLYRPPIA